MSDPLVHSPSGLYRPRPLLSGHKGIVGPTGDIWDEDADNSLSGMTVASTGELALTLLSSLLVMYKMDESGDQTDEVGFRNLTARNSPTQVGGKVGNAQQYAHATDTCHYNTSGLGGNNNSFSINCWIRSNAAPSVQSNYFFCLENASGQTFRIIHSLPSNKFQVVMAPTYGSPQYITTGTITPVIGTWYNLSYSYISDDVCQMWTNTGDFRGDLAPNGGRGANRMVFGAQNYGGLHSRLVSVDAFHWFENYILDAADRTYMYNGGAGRELL